MSLSRFGQGLVWFCYGIKSSAYYMLIGFLKSLVLHVFMWGTILGEGMVRVFGRLLLVKLLGQTVIQQHQLQKLAYNRF